MADDVKHPDAPPPAQRVLDLVRGAYDLHVHLSPDVLPRARTDIDAARRFADVGLAGMVLKSHHVPTAERAELVRSVVPGFDTRGAVTLNASVGGLNPLAVEAAFLEGAAVVWLPTVDAPGDAARRDALPTDAIPAWARMHWNLKQRGYATPSVAVLDERGTLTSAATDVLRLCAERSLVLATGHLHRDEILAVVTAARTLGGPRVVVTHADSPMHGLSADDQRRLAAAGALLERSFGTVNTGKVSWDVVLSNIDAVGPASSLLSSDLGQVGQAPVELGIAFFAERLVAEGFSEQDVRTMAVDNTTGLIDTR